MNTPDVGVTDTKYYCPTGHTIGWTSVLEESEVMELDSGARVRVCRIHGTPVSCEALKSDGQSLL